MKKLSLIIATLIFAFTMQAQNQHGNNSVQTYSTGNNYNNHNNNGFGSNNHNWNNHEVNNNNGHSYNGHSYNNHNQNNHFGNQYGHNNPNNNGHHYGNHPNNYPQITTIICHMPPPVVVQPPVYYGPSAMGNSAFQSLKITIDNQWFSSGRMNIFEQAVQNNHFNSQQVTELVQLFSFNNDQLKVAKRAYTKTVDPQNYFMVSNALQFNSAVRNLTAYIASI